MTSPVPRRRLRITPRSAVVAVVLVALAGLALGVVAAAERVLIWVVFAFVIAGIVYPAVTRLSRYMPRGLAVAIVSVVSLTVLGVLTYLVVSGLVRQIGAVQQAAPDLAARLERAGGVVGRFAREAELADNVGDYLRDLPERLYGGPRGMLRTAVDWGLTVSIVGILVVFFLLQGPGLVAAALGQVRHPVYRDTAERVVVTGFRKGFAYTRRTLVMATAVGVVMFAVTVATGLPAPVLLSGWVAIWSIVPTIGTVIGAFPALGFAASASPARAAVVGVVVVAMQVVGEALRIRLIERRTVRTGPFMVAVGVFAGLEWRPIGGPILGLLVVSTIVAIVAEVTREQRQAPDGAIATT